jgi:DNA repair protein RecO (recombination protein O)
MLVKTKGIVLNHLKYGDSSLITHIFTHDYGRKAFIIKGARSKKARIRANLFQILNVLELEFYHKESRELLLLKEVSRARVFTDFPYNVMKSAQAMFIAEVLQNSVADDDPDPVLFEFMENALEYFDLIDRDHSNFHLSLLMKLTRYLGILPFEGGENEKKNNFSLFPVRDYSQSNPKRNNEENRKMLFELFEKDFEEGSRIPLSRNKRNILLIEILRFYTANGYKLDKLKTLPVLNDLFS